MDKDNRRIRPIEVSDTMKRLHWAPQFGFLALLIMFLPSPELRAQSIPPPGQNGTPEKGAPPQAAPAPSDAITIPDGTPLTLALLSDLSSSTAKVGRSLEFVTSSALLINGLVVIPLGTAISGTVVGRDHKQVHMAIEKVVLPSGEVGALRCSKEATSKPGSIAGQRVKQSRQWVDDTGYGLTVFTMGLGLPAAITLDLIAGRKHQLIYPSGTEITVYFNGPLHVDRDAVLKLQPPQPPPTKGVAHVFFTAKYYKYNQDALFCGTRRVSPMNIPIKLDLNPGTYSFTAHLDTGLVRTVLLEVQEGHEYWIESDGQGLFVKDPLAHPAEFYAIQADVRAVSRDLTMLPAQDCPRAAQPAVQASATASTIP